MKKLNVYIGIVALTTLAFLGCKGERKVGDKVQYVKTATAESENRLNSVNYPGRTKSVDDVNVSFRVSGPVSGIMVKEGDHVRKGQLIATMDARDYEVQLEATEAEYANIKADAERVMAMFEEGNVPATAYDKARYGLQQMEQKVSHHRHQLEDTKLYAPIDGYVQTILHQAGETVAAGMPVIALFGSRSVEVEVNISAFDYANRDRLDNIYCRFDLLKDQEFPMEIASISPEANASQLYTVRLRFQGDYDRSRITPGMTTMVYVNIDGNDHSKHVTIPTTALFERDGKDMVFVYDAASGTVQERVVEVYKLHNNGLAVITAGLTAGEEVVSAGVHHISNGDKVVPIEKPSKSNVGGLL